MNKTFFRLAFLACLASSGCASPMSLFAKKPQSFDDYKSEQIAKSQARVPSSGSLARSTSETTELLNKAHTAFQQGLMNEAQANYQAILRKQPNHPEANHRLAVIADRQNDFLTAERYYQSALAAAPRDANILNDVGYSYLLQSRYAEAERYLSAALQQSPNQANAMNNMGMLYAKRGQGDQALAMFRRTSSEAEAQAKLARFLPPNSNPAKSNGAAQPNTMLANNQPWQNNSAPPNYSQPVNPQFSPQQQPPQTRPPMNPNLGYAQGLPAANPQTANSQSVAINDPNLSEPARQLKEAMERKRIEAVTERQQRDEADRQRQASLLRQMREEELGKASVTQAGASQPNGLNRGSQIPNNVPNGPIMIGPSGGNPNVYGNVNALPTSQPNPTSYAPRSSVPEGFPAAPQRQDGNSFNANSNQNPTLNQNSNTIPIPNNQSSNSQIWNVPNPPQQVLAPQQLPSNGTRVFNNSPLDAMPDFPPSNSQPTGSLPSINPNPVGSQFNSQSFAPQNRAWPPSATSNMADEAARAASRMGMSAGPGNLFPISPGSSTNIPNSTGPTSYPPQSNGGNFNSNNVNPSNFNPNGFSPNNGANLNPNNTGRLNQPPVGTEIGEPPSGSFGPGGYDTSAKSPTLPESPAQYALRDRLPPSGQYQTPAPFNAFGSPNMNSNSFAAQPTNFAIGRGIPNPNTNPQAQSTRDLIAEMERASARTTPDRAGGDDRWEQGSAPSGINANSTVPTMQGFLATQAGDNSLAEYERMSQLHNAEMNQIRQQLDSQRQLPGSENYFRSSTQSQLGTSNGNNPRLDSTSYSRRSNFNSMHTNNAARQLP